ncbi:MAG: SGNH/GDSL hydrolase family protein [Verrucomicrobiota bacterium]
MMRKQEARGNRRWVFRLMAVAIALLPFLALEIGLRLSGEENASERENPFIAFTDVHPLFSANEETGRHEIAANRLDWFYPDSFASSKPENGFRIFCLGGSTTAGRPFTIETAFSSWLRLLLEAADPERTWEVINCGGVSYASYRILPILEEILAYEPDLIVVYTGHNEFLEDRSYQNLKNLPPGLLQSYSKLSSLRTVSFLRRLYLRSTTPPESVAASRSILPQEVDALLEHRGGLEHYFRDPQWHANVTRHFSYNLGEMIRLTRKANVPLILANPSSNLRHTPPFKSVHREDLTDEERKRFAEAWSEGRQLTNFDPENAKKKLEEALAIDDRFALLHYEMAQLLDETGQSDEALASYLRAKEEDICPLRAPTAIQDAVVKAARTHDLPLIDTKAEFARVSKDGIAGSDWFLDHVHPSVKGHGFIADLLAQKMAELGYVEPPEDWKKRSNALFAAHYKTLTPDYFTAGELRLQNLRNWAAGRSAAEPPVEPTRKNQQAD